MLVPAARLNETARVIEAELRARMVKLQEKVEAGTIEESTDGT
jgi:transmembrane E3 ubiquitin-protein ligase